MKKQQGVVPFLISLFIIGGLYEPVLRFLRYLMHRPFMGLESFTRLPKDQLLMLAAGNSPSGHGTPCGGEIPSFDQAPCPGPAGGRGGDSLRPSDGPCQVHGAA